MATGGFKFGAVGAATGTPAASAAGGGLGGFSFGGSSSATPKPGALSFGTPATTTQAPTGIATGFKLGGTTPSAGGLQLGGGTTQVKGLGFGSNTTTTTSTGLPLGTGLGSTGFGLGATGTSTSGGLSLGGALGGGLGGAGASKGGLTLGGIKPTTGLGLGGQTTGTGLTLGGTASTGLGLGATAGTGLGLGGTVGTGLTLGGASTASTGLTLGGTAATTASTGLTLGGTATKIGLGGVDPSTLSTSSATSTSSTKSDSSSKGKGVKETNVPQPIQQNVTSFKEYVKKQKAIREEILRFSDKPLHRVREETAALHQLLRQVCSGLHRNAAAVRKLKEQSAQQLTDVEIAQRTREVPASLQLEYSAPAEYFQRLVFQFEQDMVLCRQQIEQMESFMAALDQPVSYSPQELSNIMVKLNETFVALAAQLQSVHEIIKAQKEQYLNYRRVYQGETQDVFSARRKLAERQSRSREESRGPQPFSQFPGMALVMATALQSAQKPAGMGGGLQTGLGAPTGLGGTTTGLGGAGTTFGTGTSGFGTGFGTGATGGFGAGSTLGGGLGAGGSTFGGGTTGLFGSKPPATTTAAPGFSFGGSLSAGPTLGTSAASGFGGFGSTPGTFGSTTTGKPLQLQKPPSKHRKSTR